MNHTNEHNWKEWYVYHRLAEDGLHEFFVGLCPREDPMSADWTKFKLQGEPFTYEDAHKMSSTLFRRMNSLSEDSVLAVTDEALELNKMFDKAKLSGEIEGHKRMLVEVGNADEQLLRLSQHYGWGESLDIVNALVNYDDDDHVVEALTWVLRDNGPDMLLGIEDFLGQLVKLDKTDGATIDPDDVRDEDMDEDVLLEDSFGDHPCECPNCVKKDEAINERQ